MPETHTPTVSVILPIYNGAAYLDEAFQSIVSQTFRDFEVLAIDDHSTDNSAEIVSAWAVKDARIQLIPNTGPNGLPNALNFGLQRARGKYMARSDQDDVHRPERLATEVAFLDTHPNIMLVGSGYQPFGQAGEQSPIYHPSAAPMIAWKMIAASAFCHPSVMFRRQVYTDIGGYPVTGSEDFAYFSVIVRRWPTANLPVVLVDYRAHATNYSVTRREAMAQSVLGTFQKNIQHYLGSDAAVSVFYDFLVRRHLPVRRLVVVAGMTTKIANKISQTYDLSAGHPQMVQLRLHILKELAVVTARTILKAQPIGAPLQP